MEADDPSVPIIDVGGNYTQGEISGQSAIGSNISQVRYTNCTFVYPDGSTKQGYSWIYTQGARPIIDPKRVFGRETELEKIENHLKDNIALVIKGFRGTGKSTLASMFFDRMGESGKFAGIYWRKMDEATDLSEIIGSFFTVIGKPVKDLERYKIPDQINLLFNELNEASYLLFLDNFEILLDPQTNKPLKSKVGFSELIESAKENCIRSKIIFTSWDALSSERGIRPFSYQIRGLDTTAGILLLRREGLLKESEDELKRAIELSGGHPLALILLVQLVTEGAGTLSALLKDGSLWIGEEGEVAENILNKVYNERLSEDERKLLQYVSIFRKPVPAEAITKTANDLVWTESKVEKIAWKLCHKSLLQKNDENYWEESLISKYAATQLFEKSERYKIAMDYYLSLPIPENPAKKEDVQPLIEAHYHACMAEEYDQAFHIIFDNNLYKCLDLWGNYTLLIDLYSKLLPEDHFGKEALLEYKGNHGVILGNIGNAYSRLGNSKKAIEYYEHALKISREIGDRQGEGSDLGNMGLAYYYLGELRKAIECYEQALEIDKEIGYRHGEEIRLGNLGIAYQQLGEVQKAIEYYEQAIEIDKEMGDRQGKGIWLGNLGLAYYYLGELRKAIEYYEQSLKTAKEIGDRQGEGNSLGNLGSAYSSLGDSKKAIEYYEQSLKISREIGDRRGEGNSLGNLGSAYSSLGDSKKAIEYYKQAFKIAKEIGDRHGEGADLGNLGNAYSHLGEPRKAIEYYEQALKISREVGDKRVEGNHLGNLGNAYRDMGEPRKAIEYYEQALKISRSIGDRRGEGAELGNLGNAYRDLGELRKAIEYYEQALEIAKETEDRHGEGNRLGNLGSAYGHLGDLKKTIEYYEQAFKISREIGNRQGEGTWLGNLGLVYYYLGETRKAIEYYEQALKIAKEIGDMRGEGNRLGNLGNAYRDMGEPRKAIEYYEQALSIGKEIEDPRIINFCERNLEKLKDSKK